RIPLAKDRIAPAAERAEGHERLLPGAQIDEVADRDELLGDAGAAIAMLELDEPVRLRIGQRPQQRRVDHREDRDVGADAERQREDRGEREARLANQEAERVAEIVLE